MLDVYDQKVGPGGDINGDSSRVASAIFVTDLIIKTVWTIVVRVRRVGDRSICIVHHSTICGDRCRSGAHWVQVAGCRCCSCWCCSAPLLLLCELCCVVVGHHSCCCYETLSVRRLRATQHHFIRLQHHPIPAHKWLP